MQSNTIRSNKDVATVDTLLAMRHLYMSVNGKALMLQNTENRTIQPTNQQTKTHIIMRANKNANKRNINVFHYFFFHYTMSLDYHRVCNIIIMLHQCLHACMHASFFFFVVVIAFMVYVHTYLKYSHLQFAAVIHSNFFSNRRRKKQQQQQQKARE